MTDFELNEKTLNEVNGGILTEEAEAWINTHRATILERAGSLASLADFALGCVKASQTVFDVPALKAAISGYGIYVDDLN